MQISSAEMIAQRAFRRLLQAMSRPGRVYVLPPAAGNGHWGPMLTLLESLLDHEVSFAVVGDGGPESLPALIAGRTRSRVAAPHEADFLIVAGGDSGGETLRARRGTLQYPDTSATVVYRVKSLLFVEGTRSARPGRGPASGRRSGWATSGGSRPASWATCGRPMRSSPWGWTPSSSTTRAGSSASPVRRTSGSWRTDMGYVAVKGGIDAIENACRAFEFERMKGSSAPLGVAQVRDQLFLLVDRGMGEGSLYAPDLAALAIRQAAGDTLEAAFLLRAYRTTRPRLG
jgi:phosphonate C-P lyase system protein PhnH